MNHPALAHFDVLFTKPLDVLDDREGTAPIHVTIETLIVAADQFGWTPTEAAETIGRLVRVPPIQRLAFDPYPNDVAVELDPSPIPAWAREHCRTIGICTYCHRPVPDPGLSGTPPNHRWNRETGCCVDHVVPRSVGGAMTRRNLVPACWDCNTAKLDTVHGWAPGSRTAPATHR